MRYATASAFRTALEERLRREHLASGTALARLRKIVAFDRLLARLSAAGNRKLVLKGGFALQVMFPNRARTTKDIDLHTTETAEQATAFLTEAAALDLGDFFSFVISPPTPGVTGLRFPVESRVDGRVFEAFHVDLGVEEPMIGGQPPGRTVTSLLAFADIAPVDFPCYPVCRHLAEKVHALTRPHGDRGGSRSKDLVDDVLLAETTAVEATELRASIETTFISCATHPIPERLRSAPRAWATEYRRTARELGLKAATLEEGEGVASALMDPILHGRTTGRWSPAELAWLRS